jgi:hypothetical protein
MIRSVPRVNTNNRDLSLIQDYITSALTDLQQLPLSDSTILANVSLAVGLNTINHTLARRLIGWVIVRKRAATDIYDTQDNNPMPQKTLLLNSSAVSTVDILVF